jgi:hypothetical protein
MASSMSRFVVEKMNPWMWRIFDKQRFVWEYVMFEVWPEKSVRHARAWMTDDMASEPGSKAFIEVELAEAMRRAGMTPPQVVGHFPPVY